MKLKLIFFVSVIFVFTSCAEEEGTLIYTANDKLTLIYPVNEKDIPSQKIEFSWEYNSDNKVEFRLYENSVEGNLIIEETLEENSITVGDLNPLTNNYYWEVKDGDVFQSSAFSTFNPRDILNETYITEVKSMFCNSAGAPGGLYTTSFSIDTMNLIPIPGGMTVKRGVNGYGRDFIFIEKDLNEEILIYSADNSSTGPNQESYLNLNLDLKTVEMKFFSGSLGGGSSWECEFDY